MDDETVEDPLRVRFEASSGDGGPSPPSPDERRRLDDIRERLFGTRPDVQRLGRFLILERIGAGGMGEVYAAYDPKLDRKLAVKIVLARRRTGSVGHESLRREARAMARVRHPNVATVYDVGDWEERPFIAMELCEGVTLPAWLERARTRDEVLDVFIAAGRGLAAAHAAGVVHYDFKPSNVMVDPSAVKVLDFGLARALADDDDDRGTGFSGTVGYAAPELVDGRGDARSDQFSFCASLFEAVYERRPFAGDSASAVQENVLNGRIGEVPRTGTESRRLRAAILRGLSVEPAARYADMNALLAELARVRAGGVRRGLVWGAGGLGLLLVAGLVVARPEGADQCGPDPARLAGVWDGPTTARVHEAILGSGGPFGETTWSRTQRGLDLYAAAWSASWQDACAATHLRHEQSEGRLDARMACLGQRRAGLAALVELLAEGDPEVTRRAVVAVTGLPSVETCSDPDTLQARFPVLADPTTRAQADDLRARLAQIEAMRDAGRYAEALEAARPLLAEARVLAVPPITAAARHRLGDLSDLDGDPEAAAELLLEAASEAIAADDPELAARATVDAMHVLGDRLDRYQAALTLRPLAEGFLRRAGDDPLGRAKLLNAVGVIEHRRGENERAVEDLRAALDIMRAQVGDEDPRVAGALDNLGLVISALGEYREAAATHRQAAEAFESALGPAHPELGIALDNMGVALRRAGEYEQAGAAHERGLQIKIDALGPEHGSVASSRLNLGTVHYSQRRYAEARRAYEEAGRIWEATLGPKAGRLAIVHNNLGNVLHEEGSYPEAEQAFRRALDIKEGAYGPDHPNLVSTLNNLGRALRKQGRSDEALAMHERALALAESARGPDHPQVADVVLELGLVHLAIGQRTLALSELRRAVEIRVAHDVENGKRGRARFELAKALAPAKQGAEARALAQRALADFEAEGPAGQGDREEVQRWLHEHAG